MVYLQYLWYFFSNIFFWLVYIFENDVKLGKVNVMDVLKKIFKYDCDVMCRVIFKDIIFKIIYGEFGVDIVFFKDVFDIVLENFLYCVVYFFDLE